jgi:hypothetical protein
MRKLIVACFVVMAGMGSCAIARAAQCQPESVCVTGQGCYIVTVCR